ncbi:MAG: ABC transporter substrate-binding protein [Xanthobacteraceae bacterium]
MAQYPSRRTLLRTGLIAGTVGGSGLLFLPAVVRGAAIPRLTNATLATGLGVILDVVMEANRFDLKHGVDLNPTPPYTSLSTYYSDLVTGNVDIGIGTWDTFATRYLAGVPIKFVCAITTAHLVNIVADADGPRTVKDLVGKTLAAPLSSGTYRLTKLVLRDFHGIELEKDVTVQNVDNPSGAPTLVMAHRADAGLSWEPTISVALVRMNSLRVIYNLGEDYKAKTGLEMPFFGFAIGRASLDKYPGIAAKITAAYRDCIATIVSEPSQAIALAAPKMQVPPEALKLGFESGRFSFQFLSMADEAGRKPVQAAGDYLAKNGVLPRQLDPGFYAS